MLRLILLFFLSIGSYSLLNGCNCQIRTSYNIKDWNDTPIIFEAELVDFIQTTQFIKLTFNQIKTLKGSVKKKISIFVKLNESHTLIHGIERYQLGDKWVVFSEVEHIGKKKYLRLFDSEDSAYCALSRPITSNDSKLHDFLVQAPTLNSKLYQEQRSGLTSIGKIRNGVPKGQWKYAYDTGSHLISQYKNGLKHGAEKFFQVNHEHSSSITKEISYVNGKKEYLKTFDHDGKVREWIVYGSTENFLLRFRDGHVVGKWLYNKKSGITTAYLISSSSTKIFTLPKPIKELR